MLQITGASIVLIIIVFLAYQKMYTQKTSSESQLDCDDGSCDIIAPKNTLEKQSVTETVVTENIKPMTNLTDEKTIVKEQVLSQTIEPNPYERNNEILTADDLLPSTDNEFTEKNNLISPDLKSQNFLTHENIDRYGINTVGSSLRNPSYDIRGTPSNPRIDTPWSNSTIDYDDNLRHMVMETKS